MTLPTDPNGFAPTTGGRSLRGFTTRLLIILIIVVAALVVWQLMQIVVLLFGAILLAIGLSAAARLVCKTTGMGRPASLAVVLLVALVFFGSALWIFGSTVAGQVEEVARAAPAGFTVVMTWIDAHPVGRELMDQMSRSVSGASFLGAAGWATSAAASIGRQVARTIGLAVVALVAALYLAAQPDLYRRLCLRLVPRGDRPAIDSAFTAVGRVLERWFVGQLCVMTVIGLLSGIGLWLLGIEAAFTLGLMGGMLCFIPFVGAILAAVPAALVALTQGPLQAVSVILMYVCVHFIEGNFVTPMVQAEATSLPPGLIIVALASFSILFGPVGVLLAAPLSLLIITVVEVIYVQRCLGEAPESGVYAPPEPDTGV